MIHKFDIKFNDIVSASSLLLAWQEFVKGKRNKRDVQEFQFNLMDGILSLRRDLISGNYQHGSYQEFRINDPKPRIIHKATVRDRLLHRAVYRILYPVFEKTFIADSYSCRINKGTHKAMNRFREFAYIVSKNNTKTCWILKCDVKKFFHSIDQPILIDILKKYIADSHTINLLKEVIFSFNAGRIGKGLPLGNLTSQLFCNIYLNEFDQFVKHNLKTRRYIRYADDFLIFSQEKNYLESLISKIEIFLSKELSLHLHQGKVSVKTLASGADFLGWVHFFDHRVLRNAMRRRMFKKIKENPRVSSLNSYMGLLSHGNSYKIKGKLIIEFICY